MKKLLGSKKSKIIAVLVIAALVVSAAAVPQLYQNSNAYAASTVDATEKTQTESAIEKEYPNLMSTGGKDKTETVYVVMDANNKVSTTVVEEQLANKDEDNKLKDVSNLNDIENTSGDEEYVSDGNNIIWSADGNAINYKGTTSNSLPASVKISYYLNGKKMSAKDIAGQKGNVTIRFDYSISASDEVDGVTYTHPYAFASGLMLDNEHFSDIEVTNGKTVNDGDNTIALGVAMPGMNRNLNIDKSDFEIPNSVEITAYTDDFELSGTYTIAMQLNLEDLSDLGDDASGLVTELEDAMSQLSSASEQLLDGTSALEDGTAQLLEGAATLKSGSSDELTGLKSLNSGLQQLSSNSSAINKGTKQIETQIFATATEELNETLAESGMSEVTLTPSTYTKVINGISSSAISSAESQLRSALSANGITDSGVQTQIISLAYNNLAAAGNTSPSTDEITAALTKAATMAGEAQAVQSAVATYKTDAVTYLVSTGEAQEDITEGEVATVSMMMYIANQKFGTSDLTQLTDYLSSLQETASGYVSDAALFSAAATDASDNVSKLAAMAVGSDTPEALSELKSTLDQVETYVAGVNQYTAGVDSAAAGSAQLVSGMSQIDEGIGSLEDGIEALNEGARDLNNGMEKFDKEGIQKFVDSLDDSQLDELNARFQGVAEASKNTVMVGGISDDMSGESKIIFRTGEVSAE